MRVGGAWTTYRDRRLKVLEARLAGDSGRSGESGTILLGPRPGDGPAVEAPCGDSPAVEAATGRSPAVEVVAGQGGVELVALQLEGRAPVLARDWVNGARITGGERFE